MLVYAMTTVDVGYILTWLIDASEENAGDRQRNTAQVDHPPRVGLNIGHRTELPVSTLITIHCIAGRLGASWMLENTDLIDRQVIGHVTHLVGIRLKHNSKIAQ